MSPLRNSSQAKNVDDLVDEQLAFFGINKNAELGQCIVSLTRKIYECEGDIDNLSRIVISGMKDLPATDKIALFNAKKFLSFQLAKILDDLQTPFRKSYQAFNFDQSTLTSKSSYPIFDNVAALFSATPVITRTATYIYACAEWIADAFEGKELMLEIYSRLLNPTSISLANHIVDLEAGQYAGDYLAWNFNSGMAAIDATLSHLLGYEDIIIANQNIYGGAHQLIHDWFAKPSNLHIAVERYAGEGADEFLKCLNATKIKYAERLKTKNIYLYIESPCNPHGYVLDVPALCKAAHANGVRVILDATVGTPFLHQPLKRIEIHERPDFVIHSYTKDLSGHGSVIAGCVIARNEDMFIPKGMSGWDKTMFWNVYYVKGAFLAADAAFEVLQGMRTLEVRMLKKCINTVILSRFLNTHPKIKVNCNALENNKNRTLCQKQMLNGLPAPLFTIEINGISEHAFKQFFDHLEPVFGHMISLGQTNTIVSCPGLTTHSELNPEQQKHAEIFPTTIRFAMGIESPKDLIYHFLEAAKLVLDKEVHGFTTHFPNKIEISHLIESTYINIHQQYAATAFK